jgi:LacI family transcriptional regulator
MRVRRADVAQLAGTSPAVVSYVLNDGPRPVAPATRARVLAAIEQLDYRPNGVARSLRLQRTMTLGLVIPDSANPFFAELSRAVEAAAFARNYTLLVGNSNEDDARQQTYVRTFVERGVDGLLLVPAHGEFGALSQLERAHVPWAVMDRHLVQVPHASSVHVDNVAGARAATEHLLEHGRVSVACIAGPDDVTAANERAAGWRSALPPSSPQLIRRTEFGREAGYRAALELGSVATFDALFVASDEQAVGVVRALRELGLRCPEDVAVVSFDGVSSTQFSTPTLTTMAQPFESIGETAVELLLERMSSADTPPRHELLPTSLKLGQSCGCQAPDPVRSLR